MKKLLAALLMAVSATACTQIDTGNTGVESTFGQIKDQTNPPGIYFTAFKTMYEVNTREFGVEVNDLKPKAKDNVTLTDVDVTVYVRTSPQHVAKIMTKYAGDMTWDSNSGAYIVGFGVLTRTAREAVYTAIARYNASEIHTKRSDLAAEVRASLQRELDADAGKNYFEVTNVIVRNIVTDPRLEEAIKLSAEVEFAVRRKQQELEFAKAEAARKKVEAEGEAVANRIIAESITPELIELRRIEAMSGFAKQGTHTVIIPQNTQPLVQVK